MVLTPLSKYKIQAESDSLLILTTLLDQQKFRLNWQASYSFANEKVYGVSLTTFLYPTDAK